MCWIDLMGYEDIVKLFWFKCDGMFVFFVRYDFVCVLWMGNDFIGNIWYVYIIGNFVWIFLVNCLEEWNIVLV